MKNQIILVLALTIFTLTCVSSAYAEDPQNLESSNSYYIYVNASNTHASDSNNGTSWEYAKKTIKNATGTVTSGGTVYISSGTYKGDSNRGITINKNLNIIGNGKDGAGNTTIDAEHDDLIFYIDSGFIVSILNLTLQNGEAHDTLDGHDGDPGGAIYNKGTLTVQNCNFLNNRARNGDSPGTGSGIGRGGDGGAIYNNNGILTLQNCYFESNHAGDGGDATPSTDAKDGGNGGAIYSAGTLTIQNCTFKDNYAGDGGGNSGCPGSWGASGGYGGAIYIYKGTVNITDSNFNKNNAGNGHNGGNAGYAGAIYNNGTLSLQNCNLTGNFAGNGGSTKDQKNGQDGGNGGGIYNINTLTIQNCIFNGNYAGNGGNAGDLEGGNGGDGGAIYNTNHANITDSNFNGNYAGKGSDASGSSNASNGGNGGTIYNDGNLTISGGEISNSRGGTAGSAYAEQDGGDGGNGGAIYNKNILTILNCNIHNNNATNGSNAATTGSVPGSAGCGGGIYNSGTLNITDSNITANYAGKGGDACSNKAGAQGGSGGGIYNIKISYLQNCILDSNYAGEGGDGQGYEDGGDGGHGGGIYSNNTLTIENCTISNSYAGKGRNAGTAGSNPGIGGYGGGIYIEGNSTISDSVIHDNYAGDSGNAAAFENGGHGGYGGGIYTKNSLSLINCEIYNNTAGTGGLAVDVYTGGNGGYGGGIYSSGNLTITGNSRIHNNNAGKGGDGNIIAGLMYGDGGEGGYGGGIYSSGNLTITGNSTNYIEIDNNAGGQGGKSQNDDQGGNGGKGGGIYTKGQICIIKFANIHDNKGGEGNDGDHESYLDVDGGNGGDGGAIYNEGSLNLEECILNNNQGGPGKSGMEKSNTMDYGGGEGGNGGNGGAIANSGILTVTNCQLTGNKGGNGGKGGQATYAYNGGDGGQGGNGGAIYNTGTLTITGSSFTQNSGGTGGEGGLGRLIDHAEKDGPDILTPSDPGDGGEGGNGGTIYNSGTITSITNTTIENNNAGTGGLGGLYGSYDYTHWIKNVHYGGSGGSGGGIYNAGHLNLLENTTIDNNKAGNGGDGQGCTNAQSDDGGEGGNGGGILIYGSIASTIQIINCSISNNQAGNGGNGGPTYIDEDDFYPADDPGDGGNAGSGGGIHIYYKNKSSNLAITIYISNSTITNNTAGNGGNGGIDTVHSHSSDSGEGGNGGGIATTSEVISSPSYGLHLYMLTNTITNNKVGNGGQPYQNGNKGSDGVGGGLYSSDNHYFTINFCRILNNTPQAVYLNLSSVNTYIDLWNNWWGSNNEPKDQITGKNISSNYYTPWIVLNINASSNLLYVNQTSNITTNLIMNSEGQNTYNTFGIYVPNDIPVTFASSIGYVNPENNAIHDGISNTIFNPNSVPGTATVYATVDYQTVSTQIQVPSADIEVIKTINNTMPNVGDSISFTVTAKNNGPDKATNIQIKDVIPPHFDHLSINYSTGTYQNNIWTIPQLANGSNATFIITGTVTSSFVGLNTTNTATKIAEDQIDPNPDNDNSSASFYVPIVNMNITQKPWYYDSQAGTYQTWSDYNNVIVYIVTAQNTGPDDSTGIIIKELIGNGYDFVGLSTEGVGNASYDQNTRTITWNIANMLANTKACLSIFALVTGIGNNTPELTVNASLNHVDQYDTPGQNKSSSWSIYVPVSADIQINQTQQNSTETEGQYITYTITVTNNGPNNATAIQITDILPAGLIINSITGNYVIDSNSVIWTIDNLNIGENTTLTLKTLINSTGTFVNTVTKTAQVENDWNYNNNAQTCIFTLSGNYTPQVNMNVYQDPAYYDTATGTYQKESEYYKTIVYSVEVKNNGPTDATGVIVIDVLGEGYDFINCTTRGVGTANYDPTTHTLTWNVGYVPVGGKAYLSIFALVIAVGNNTPELTINASLNHVDQNDTPNSHKYASYSIYVPTPTELSNADQQSNLTINGTFNNITTNPGETFTATFKLGNKGPDVAKNVIIKIPIPEGLEFITASVDQGTWYYNEKTRTIIWYIEEVPVGDPYITVTLKSLQQGQFTIIPRIITNTYNRYSGESAIPLTINIITPEEGKGNTVNAASRTISMQETGIPIATLILAILAVLIGFIPKRK